MEKTVTIQIDKWQAQPEPKWVLLKKVTAQAKVTAKRTRILTSVYKDKVFDNTTGSEVTQRDFRMNSWYRYTLRKE